MTDRQVLEDIQSKIKKGNTMQFIQTAIAIIGFLGIVTFAQLLKTKK